VVVVVVVAVAAAVEGGDHHHHHHHLNLHLSFYIFAAAHHGSFGHGGPLVES
jgi:hypothetical protein